MLLPLMGFRNQRVFSTRHLILQAIGLGRTFWTAACTAFIGKKTARGRAARAIGSGDDRACPSHSARTWFSRSLDACACSLRPGERTPQWPRISLLHSLNLDPRRANGVALHRMA